MPSDQPETVWPIFASIERCGPIAVVAPIETGSGMIRSGLTAADAAEVIRPARFTAALAPP